MIVLDSSAVLAVLFAEPEAGALIDVLEGAGQLAMSAANALECAIRLAPGPDKDETAAFDRFVALYEVAILPVDVTQLKLARAAYLAFGKSRHPARLNYGDCFAYALAQALDAPLLFIGGDFSRTDIRPALG